MRRFDRRKTDGKRSGKTRAAVLIMCAVLWLTACLTAGFTAGAAGEDVDAAEAALMAAVDPDAAPETEAAVDPDATAEPEVTVDPDATPIPTYNGDKIAFEVPEGGGKKNTSTAGGIIMIIIIALAFISVASGIVEKIVQHYKHRDDRFSKE